MKIVIIGSHSVGKTTIAKQITDYLNQINKAPFYKRLIALLKTKEDEMKVGVTGSHGTGKTTLSKLMTGRNPQYRYLPEAPFQAFHSGFPMNEDSSLATELVIFGIQAQMEESCSDFVADKCFIDLLAYAQHLFPDDPQLLDVLTRVAKNYIDRYDLVIYLPAGEFPIEDDGYRSLDPQFQMAIDQKILALMQEMNIKHHRLTGSKEKRYKDAMIIINELLGKTD